MKFGRPDVSNPAGDLSQLRLSFEHHEDGTASLKVHLLFGTADIPIDPKSFEAFATRAILRVHCEGVEIEPGSQYGEFVRPQSEKGTVTISSDATTEAHIEGGLTIAADARALTAATGSISAKAGGSSKSEGKVTVSKTVETETLRVEALGGDRWLITEPVKTDRLRGTYLKNEALCRLRTIGRANRKRIEVSVEIRQRDLVFDPPPAKLAGRILGGTNREKLVGVMMAKSVHEKIGDGQPFNGVLVASAGVCEVDEE